MNKSPSKLAANGAYMLKRNGNSTNFFFNINVAILAFVLFLEEIISIYEGPIFAILIDL